MAQGRITQQRTEIIRQGSNTQQARTTQMHNEVINISPNATLQARVTQMHLEIIYRPGTGGYLWNPFGMY